MRVTLNGHADIAQHDEASPTMTKYILQRILAALPVLFGILFITFALARLLPGDPCVADPW